MNLNFFFFNNIRYAFIDNFKEIQNFLELLKVDKFANTIDFGPRN